MKARRDHTISMFDDTPVVDPDSGRVSVRPSFDLACRSCPIVVSIATSDQAFVDGWKAVDASGSTWSGQCPVCVDRAAAGPDASAEALTTSAAPSVRASIRAERFAGRLADDIRHWIQERGAEGATADQVATAFRLKIETATARIHGLRKAKRITAAPCPACVGRPPAVRAACVRCAGRGLYRRLTTSGSPATVYVAGTRPDDDGPVRRQKSTDAPRGPDGVHLGPVHRRILREIVRVFPSGLTCAGIEKRLSIQHQTASPALRALYDVGFVDRPRRSERRFVHVVTEAGVEYVERYQREEGREDAEAEDETEGSSK